MAVRNVPTAAAGPRVRDAMLRAPETLDPTVTVAEARFLLENPRLRLLLIADGAGYVGVVSRRTLESHLDGTTSLGELARADGATVGPDEPLERALRLLVEERSERLPVVTDDGRLAGLICFNHERNHFCVDAD